MRTILRHWCGEYHVMRGCIVKVGGPVAAPIPDQYADAAAAAAATVLLVVG